MTKNLERARLFQERVHAYTEAGLLHEGTHLKENWRTFSYILATLPIMGLYHITTSYNVKSIFEHGLVSNSKQGEKGISATCPLFAQEARADFVNLSFCPAKNILDEIKQKHWQAVQLTIDPIAALLKGTQFSYWDASDGCQRYYTNDSTEALLKVNFDAELQDLSSDQQKSHADIKAAIQNSYRNAVILVPDRVPSFLIKDIKLL